MPVPGSVSYAGVIPPDEVVSFLERFDLFVLPTLGENFGHVVLESLAAGTPVVIGNNAPWSQVVSSGAGWVCDPGNPGAIADLIDNFLSLDPAARHRMRAAARQLASEVLHESSSVTANRSMFRALTSSESS
jgi:glycosyltransferase involved in cell wall biosynthesis